MVGGSERNCEEALDHCVHLLGHLEMVEMPGTDGDPDLEVGLDLEQPERVGLQPEPGPDQQNRDLAAREKLASVPLADPANDCCCHGLARSAHVLDDPPYELVVSCAHVVDVLAA